MFLPNFFFTQLMDEGKKSENIFFTEVVSWKLPFQEGIFTCVTKRKNVFLDVWQWVKQNKKSEFFFFMCKWFFFPSGENFLFTEWNWMKETFSGFFFFFSGEFLHCMKLREKKSSQFEKFRNKREKNVFLQNIFFLNLWNWCYEWNQSEKCFISCLKQKENILKKHFKCENFFFPVFLLSTYLMELFE